MLNYDRSEKSYGYYFDSNLAVTTDMFTEYTGKAKKNRIKQILSQSKNLINIPNPENGTQKNYTNKKIQLPIFAKRCFLFCNNITVLP